MKTLYEEVRRKSPEVDGAEVIYIQNVADYLYSLEKEYTSVVSDFPNIAPPFPCFWMEFVLPDKLYDGNQFFDTPDRIKFGYLFTSKEVESGDTKWVTKITAFAKLEDFVSHGFNEWTVEIDKEGKDLNGFHFRVVPHPVFAEEERLKQEIEQYNHAYNMLCPCLLAISFLHCKNVHIVSHEPRAAGRRPKRNAPKIRFHTLQIEPMKKILRDEGKAEETGIKHALHICRGHFKDFTQGKGLFGRYKEIYWWDSQVRGSGVKGAVVKNYNVNKPED